MKFVVYQLRHWQLSLRERDSAGSGSGYNIRSASRQASCTAKQASFQFGNKTREFRQLVNLNRTSRCNTVIQSRLKGRGTSGSLPNLSLRVRRETSKSSMNLRCLQF